MAQVNAGRVRFVSRGEYNNSTQYYLFDLVDYNGSSYFAKANTTGNVPTNTTYWQLVAEKGNTGGDGPVGPTGNGIASIIKTASAGLIDTYTITYTNGTTTTFEITNGADGEVTQEYVDEENERLRSIYNVLPKVSDSGEELELENTGDTMLYKLDLKGNTSQEVIQGEVGLKVENTSIYVDDVNEDKENYITLEGNTYQDSTQGNQLIDFTNPTAVNSAVTYSFQNNILSASGTGIYISAIWNITSLYKANTGKTLKFSFKQLSNVTGSGTIAQINVSYNDGTVTQYLPMLNRNGKLTNRQIPNDVSNVQDVSFSIYPNNQSPAEAGSVTIEEPLLYFDNNNTYEPYTNGASPNPDYPQEIEVVTGENIVTICGKNVFNIAKLENASWNYPNSNTRVTMFLDKVAQGTKMSVTNRDTTNYRFSVGFTKLSYASRDNIMVNESGWQTTSTYTVTASGEGYPFLQISRIDNGNISASEVEGKFQFEYSDSATTYEAYKGQTYEVNLGRYVPVGYTQVDYIENSGTQFIDTGFKPNQDTSVEMEVLIPQNSAEITRFFETRNTNYVNKSFGLLNFRDFNNIFQFRYDVQFAKNNYKLDVETKYKIRTNKNNVYVNDEWIFNANPSSFQTNYNLALFGFANNSDNVADSSTYRLYSFKLYDNGVLIRDYVPCYRNSDNEVGLYDFVNKVFYTNSGTGAFTYGNVVPNTSIELCKIGTYQDRIYKSLVDGNWYKHSEIGKYTFTGNEDVMNFGDSTYEFRITTNLSNIKDGTANIYCLCDKLVVSTGNSMWNKKNTAGYNLISAGPLSSNFLVILNDITTSSGISSALSTLKPVIYYVLSTPTETQITDTTLVNQLNALYNATIYSTTHINTETSNLLPYIDLKYNVVTASPSPERASEVKVVTGNNTITISNEDGTKTQTFNINLGSLEFCKIGDYQDYFYKENGNWYKYGAIGKTTDVVGSTSITINDMINNGGMYSLYGGTLSGKTITYDSALLRQNTIYYPLSTPTTTQITDQLLVSQLDELQKAMSYYDKTLITQTNASKPFILDVIGIRDLQDLFNL